MINGQLKGTSQSTYKGGLLRGSQLLNEKFILQWQDDAFQDYLGPPAAEAKPEAVDVLRRLTRQHTDNATPDEDDVILTEYVYTVVRVLSVSGVKTLIGELSPSRLTYY